jgi:hypothetical protein
VGAIVAGPGAPGVAELSYVAGLTAVGVDASAAGATVWPSAS